jgi:hypothetical protein
VWQTLKLLFKNKIVSLVLCSSVWLVSVVNCAAGLRVLPIDLFRCQNRSNARVLFNLTWPVGVSSRTLAFSKVPLNLDGLICLKQVPLWRWPVRVAILISVI